MKNKIITDVYQNTIMAMNDMTTIQVNDEVSHHVPSALVGNNVHAGSYINQLLKITSNRASQEHKAYLTGMLSGLVSFNPDVSILVDKFDKNYVVQQTGRTFGNTSGKTVDNQIYINLNTPSRDLDLLETVTHEYVHASTNDVVQNPDGTDRQIMLDLQNHIKEQTKDLADRPRFLDYFLGSYTDKDGHTRLTATREMFTIGLTNEPVKQLLQTIPYQGKSAYDILNNYFIQAVNTQAQERQNASLRQQSRDDGRSSTDDGRGESVLQETSSAEATRPRVPQSNGETSQAVSRQPISTITYEQAKEQISTLSKQDKATLRDTVAKHLNTDKPTLKQVAHYVMEFGLPSKNSQSLDEQKQEIKEQYKDNPNYLKAPNGKPTKLSEDEWLLVRTPSFKQWFGDWENSDAVRQRLTEPTNTRVGLDSKPRSTNRDLGTVVQGQERRTVGVSHSGVQKLPEIPINLDPETLEPRLFYHGTDTVFTKFEIGHVNKKDLGWLGRGAYLTTSHLTAWEYAQQKTKNKDNQHILSFFVRTDNLYEFSHKDKSALSKADETKILSVTKQMTDDGLQGSYIKLPNFMGLEVAVFNADNIMDSQGVELNQEVSNDRAWNTRVQQSRDNAKEQTTGTGVVQPTTPRDTESVQGVSTTTGTSTNIKGNPRSGSTSLEADESQSSQVEQYILANDKLPTHGTSLYRDVVAYLMANVGVDSSALTGNKVRLGMKQLNEMYQEAKQLLMANPTTTTPQQTLNQFLLNLAKQVNPSLKVETKSYADGSFGGEYVPSSNTIYINDTLKADDYYKVLNHEIYHALTETGLTKNTQAVKDLKAIHQQLKDKAQGKWTHELQDVNEFVAYVMTDKAFMDWVLANMDLQSAGVNPKMGRLSNKLREFVNIVLHVFGLGKSNQNLNTLISLVNDVMEQYDPNHIGDTVRHSLHADATQVVNETNISQVYKDLPSNVSDAHNEHLDSIIDNIIGTYEHTQSRKQADIKHGKLKNTSLLNGYQTSDKEAYVADTLIAIFDAYLKGHQGTLAVNGLYSLYKDALSQYKSAKDLFPDFSQASKEDKAKMTKMYNFVFNNSSKQSSVARFMAMNLANEQFRSLMSHAVKPTKQADSWFDKVMGIFEKVLGWFNHAYFKPKSNKHKDVIDAMTKRLVDLDIKARNSSVDLLQLGWERGLELSTKFTDKPLKKGLRTAIKLSAKTNLTPLRMLDKAMSINQDLDDLSLLGKKESLSNTLLAQLNQDTRYKVIQDTLNEITQYGKRGRWIEQAVRLTQSIGRIRQGSKDSTIRVLNEVFTKELNKTQKTHLTQAVLKTELSALVRHGFKVDKLSSILTNPDKTINDYANRLINKVGYDKANDMLMQSKALGFYMANEQTVRNLTKSAQGIAVGLGTDYETSFDEMDNEVYELVDVLSTLYAISYTSDEALNTVKQLLQDEPLGMQTVLNLHKGLVDKGADEFSHNPLNYQKGYLPQIVNPYRKLMWATTSDEINQLKQQGFEVVDVLTQDDLDNTEARTLMLHTAYASNKRVSGGLDMADTHSRGTTIYEQGIHDADIRRVAKDNVKHRNQRNKQSYQDYDPSVDKDAMVAIYATDGAILSYHYEMSGLTQDTFLEREMSFDELLGKLHGNLLFKQEMRQHQRDIAKQIFKDQANDYHQKPNEYVVLDFDSTDPHVQEVMRMLPYAFREEIIKHFKDNLVPVHKSVYTSMFGFRAYSIANMFDKLNNPEVKLNQAEKLITGIFKVLFHEKARQKAVNFEKLIQDFMSTIKDYIVVRSGGVLVGNIISNMLLLSLHGVNPIRILKDSIFAWRNTKRYTTTQAKVNELQVKLLGLTDTRQIGLIKRQLVALNKERQNNPMHKFMQAGLMSTIVEDLSLQEDKYKTPLQESMDKYLERIPKPIRDVVGILTLDKGTLGHNFLSEATQFSDLSAKYVLAKYNMDKGMDLQNALYESQINFINYDIPTNQFLDYMNRMGFMLFTKFFLRFQQVMLKMAHKLPVASLAQYYAVEHLGGQGIYEPFIFNRLGNPFDGSVLLADNAFAGTVTAEMIGGIF